MAGTATSTHDGEGPDHVSLDEFENHLARRALLRGVGEFLPLIAVMVAVALVALLT